MSEAGRLQNHHDRTVESIGTRGARITCLMAEPGNTRQSCRDGVCWSWMDGDWSWRERRRERAGCGVSRGVCGLVGVRDTTPEPHPAPTGTTRRGRTGYSAGLGRWGARRPRSEKKGSISTKPTHFGSAPHNQIKKVYLKANTAEGRASKPRGDGSGGWASARL